MRSAFFSLNQEPWRNSTATGNPSFSRFSRITSRASLDGKTHFGNCRKTAPSLPASITGASPSWKLSYTASISSFGRSLP